MNRRQRNTGEELLPEGIDRRLGRWTQMRTDCRVATEMDAQERIGKGMEAKESGDG